MTALPPAPDGGANPGTGPTPRLLDVCCKAGGASMGYHLAGFDVVGVDIEPQPRYPFEFVQADALDALADEAFVAGFDALAGSPPCQAHSDLRHAWNAKQHPDLVGPVRDLMAATGLPYVIENVEGAPLRSPILLCGTGFGLGTAGAELRRHRLFEINWRFDALVPPCAHGRERRVIGVYGGHGRDRRRTAEARDFTLDERREAMGIDWMTGAELSQAIPPAYTRHIGEALMDQLRQEAAA